MVLRLDQKDEKAPTVTRLLSLWEKRYTPNFSAKDAISYPSFYKELIKAALPQGKALTVAKLNEQIVQEKCRQAALKLYIYIPHLINLVEVGTLSQLSVQIYLKTLEIYQKLSLSGKTTLEELSTIAFHSQSNFLCGWEMPIVEELTIVLEPLLLKFQAKHLIAKDWRTLGFLTTQFHFANKLLLDLVTPAEQLLLKPYFQFIEEQIALPWQRVCNAAIHYNLDDPAFTLVEQLLPESQKISERVFSHIVEMFPDCSTRSGAIIRSDIAHSYLRDLNMWQAYIWLGILEKSLKAIEEELLILCIIVLPRMGVRWELIEISLKLLMDEILIRVTSSQSIFFLPYVEKLKQILQENRTQLSKIS